MGVCVFFPPFEPFDSALHPAPHLNAKPQTLTSHSRLSGVASRACVFLGCPPCSFPLHSIPPSPGPYSDLFRPPPPFSLVEVQVYSCVPLEWAPCLHSARHRSWNKQRWALKPLSPPRVFREHLNHAHSFSVRERAFRPRSKPTSRPGVPTSAHPFSQVCPGPLPSPCGICLLSSHPSAQGSLSLRPFRPVFCLEDFYSALSLKSFGEHGSGTEHWARIDLGSQCEHCPARVTPE